MRTFFKSAKKVIHKKRKPLTATVLLGFVLTSYQNCQQQEFYEKANLSEIARDNVNSSTETPTLNDPTPSQPSTPVCENGQSTPELICNPLGGNNSNPTTPTNPPVAGRRLGLIGHVYEGGNNWNYLDKYFIDGYKHPEKVFFSNFNVPKRSFSEGFNLSDEEFLKSKAGDKLIEWFAIEANGQISLPESELEGEYHIMTLSDDGIEVSVDDEVILKNKGTHAATFDCALKTVNFKKGEEHKFRLRYFQGPRYHIALMTFIKKVDSTQIGAGTSSCPKVLNPGDLLNKGYKVINPEWFTLPEDFNP